MSFPVTRLRRLRSHPRLRDLVRETSLSANDFIAPLFVREGDNNRAPIASMPGQFQLTVDLLAEEIAELEQLGIPGVLLFGIPDTKDAEGSSSWSADGIISRAIRAIKATGSNILVVTDLCFCEYTDHGHCGILTENAGQVDVDNDATLPNLARQAVAHAKAGADVIAPSGMMDGMVAAIRTGLDEAGYTRLPIMSYAAKYASGFYGPFREAAESTPQFGDRHSYQMDPANRREALREVALDVEEGADLLMVKPALAYLDVIADVKAAFPQVPLAAYQVSGEYAMIKAAGEKGWLDESRVAMESLIAIKRAGADIIISYYAKEAARWLRS